LKPIDRSNGLTGFLGWVISNEVNIFCCNSHGQTRNTETERLLARCAGDLQIALFRSNTTTSTGTK
jgi:hypothetical protein